VNSVCPGIVNSDIGRVIAGRSGFMKIGVPLYMRILGKSTDSGARAYVNAARTPVEEHVSENLDLYTMAESMNNIDGVR
jgi:hypothetical protein